MKIDVADQSIRSGTKDDLWYRSAYEGVEAMSNFPSRGELDDYRVHLLEKSNAMVKFILKHTDVPFRLLEIGTGNGRIPIVLMAQGALEYALGLDISNSRIEFARRWAEDMKLDDVDFEVRDVLTDVSPEARFDMAICLTGAFGYFDASRKGAGRQVLLELSKNLTSGGKLILEIYTHPILRHRCLESPDGIFRYWERLAQKDPFAFYLHEAEYEETESILRVQKIFIRRSDGYVDESRCEYLRLYTDAELELLLGNCGFEILSFSGSLSEDPDHEEWHGTRIVVARKNDRGAGCPS